MWFDIFIRGVIIGLAASIPTGPMGVLCIQRTLSKNQRSGFVTGLGIATADTFFAAIAFFSLTMVLSFIRSNEMVITVASGICVAVVGVFIFLRNPVVQIRRNRAGRSDLWQDYSSVLLITLANPVFILYFITLFAAFGLNSADLGMFSSILALLGVLAGAVSWWFLLTFGINLLRRRFRPRHLLWINRVSGTLIVVLGLGLIVLAFLDTHLNEMFIE